MTTWVGEWTENY